MLCRRRHCRCRCCFLVCRCVFVVCCSSSSAVAVRHWLLPFAIRWFRRSFVDRRCSLSSLLLVVSQLVGWLVRCRCRSLFVWVVVVSWSGWTENVCVRACDNLSGRWASVVRVVGWLLSSTYLRDDSSPTLGGLSTDGWRASRCLSWLC